MDFAIAGASAMAACCFTNPLEVLKTRLQLQGELRAKNQHTIHYKNVVHAAYVVAKNDGPLALQKGLVPALWVQLIMNGMRLGTFQFGENHGYVTDSEGNLVFYKSVIVGGTGGVVGQYFASPFFLVKTHLQSQAAKAIAVGHQHEHEGTWSAFKKIYHTSGIKGLFRGAGASIPRAFVGSTSQLTSFKYSKEFLNQYDYFSDKPLLTSFCGSMVGGVAISVMMTPFDLIMTRLYNQPVDPQGKGLLYANYFDCVIKIFKTEGVSAFYKGVGPMYLRLGPHTVLCLVFWDELKRLYDKFLQ
ncbi:solute carrier family 25 member 35 isoform X1 [Tribolium castaneum]|uniref:solute carrier family 25 member 35 isoform X1 n=1 Tax=Tribolium castaneum TaxID=7070 RepID=UPI00077DBE91|nr:PREDICTED: solute carrier family 25 member 35 isoform X1 [Tribolium castaneum]XP_015839281.1 PREDICTED: solute carrier family 25 member 35 isoform X1 [Tribolium castaneum]|eukprot:XP_008198494.2 PREDICTED: solute carrier family 25 member 35 isoform X1 [Tribolium castaneum]